MNVNRLPNVILNAFIGILKNSFEYTESIKSIEIKE